MHTKAAVAWISTVCCKSLTVFLKVYQTQPESHTSTQTLGFFLQSLNGLNRLVMHTKQSLSSASFWPETQFMMSQWIVHRILNISRSWKQTNKNSMKSYSLYSAPRYFSIQVLHTYILPKSLHFPFQVWFLQTDWMIFFKQYKSVQ